MYISLVLSDDQIGLTPPGIPGGECRCNRNTGIARVPIITISSIACDTTAHSSSSRLITRSIHQRVASVPIGTLLLCMSFVPLQPVLVGQRSFTMVLRSLSWSSTRPRITP